MSALDKTALAALVSEARDFTGRMTGQPWACELIERLIDALPAPEASSPVQAEPNEGDRKLADWIEQNRQSATTHPEIVGLNPEDWDRVIDALRAQPVPAAPAPQVTDERNEKELAAFTQYRRSQIAELRPYVLGEDMTGVSISAPDKEAGSPKLGDMIARNPKNHVDQWLVAAQYFSDNFEAAALPMQGEWQLIDSAPKDGTGVLAAHENASVMVWWNGFWDAGWTDNYGDPLPAPVTHWLPGFVLPRLSAPLKAGDRP